MSQITTVIQQYLKRSGLAIGILMLCLASWAIQLPAWADAPSQPLTAEEKLQRAYDVYDQDAGYREEIYLESLEHGRDPSRAPKAFERTKTLDGKDVPVTSQVEKAASKIKEVFQGRED